MSYETLWKSRKWFFFFVASLSPCPFFKLWITSHPKSVRHRSKRISLKKKYPEFGSAGRQQCKKNSLDHVLRVNGHSLNAGGGHANQNIIKSCCSSCDASLTCACVLLLLLLQDGNVTELWRVWDGRWTAALVRVWLFICRWVELRELKERSSAGSVHVSEEEEEAGKTGRGESTTGAACLRN